MGMERRSQAMKKVTTLWSVWAVSMIASLGAWGWNYISVPGDAFPTGWNEKTNDLPTHSGSVWSGDLAVKGAGDFKFAANHSWNVNWGAKLTIERLPAYGVGPLYDHGDNIHLGVDKAQTIHFAFDETALTCDLTGVAPPAVSSAKLIGDFNQDGALDAGALEASGAGLWTTEHALTIGDNLRLLVNGSEWWGTIQAVSPSLPASLSMCGSAPVSIADFRSGTFRVTFDSSSLMLSIVQTATNEFKAAGYAADSANLANLKRQDVNLVRESANLYAGNFWSGTQNNDITLSFSERDANGTPGGTYWSAPATNRISVGASAVAETYTPVDSAAAVQCRTYRFSVPGMYRITFNPNTGEATLQRSYTAASGINLVSDPSFESGNGWNFYNAERAVFESSEEAACLHSGKSAGRLLPLRQHSDDNNLGSISTVLDVSGNVGSSLKISAWIRTLGEWNATRTRFWVEWKDADWKTVAEKDMTLYDLSSFWKKYTLEAEIPEGATQANILIQFQDSKEGDGYVCVDDVEVLLSSGRTVNFDTWGQVENGQYFGSYSPDWRGTDIRTTNNVSDAVVEAGSLFFSRYVEGSDNNKALEIFNPTAAAADLSGWTVKQYNNGSATNVTTFALSGTVATGGCFLITRPVEAPYDKLTPVAAELRAASDLQLPLTFNGDDVVVLCDPSGTVMDRIGELRSDITGSLLNYLLRDHTLVRASTTAHGTAGDDLAETFPYAEWDVQPCDTFEGLKSHVYTLPDDVYIPSGLSLVFGPAGVVSSPSDPLDGGIGDVSFWYRTAFPQTAGHSGSATLVLEAASDAAFSDATELATLVIPSTQYAFSNFSMRLDLPEMSYFRIRQTSATGEAYARIDDLSVAVPLPVSRYQDFALWTNANWSAYIGTYSLAGWTLSAGKITPDGGLSASPAAILPPGATVVSPAIEGGVGLVLFATRNDPADEDSDAYAVTVEASTDGGEKWTAIGSFATNGATWAATRFECGETADTIIRFTSSGTGNAILENIELRIPESDSRNQNFDSWVQSSYGTSRHQGWFMSSGITAADAAKEGAKGLRMKTGGALVQSARLEGGIGTLTFWARPSSASAKPGFQVDYSTDGGTNWTMKATNRLDGASSTEWQEFSVQFDREDITHVRIKNNLSQAVCVDSIVCGKIPVPPSLSITPFASPAAPRPGDQFKLAAFIHPGGSAKSGDILSAAVDYTIRKGAKLLETGTRDLVYAADQGAWFSDKLDGQDDGITVQYTVRVTWLSNAVETVSTADADFFVSALANSGVWINEVVYAALDKYDNGGGGDGGDCDPWSILEGTCTNSTGSLVTMEGHEYVEICGPAGTKLDGWKLEFQFLRPADISAYGKATYATYTFKPATTIPSSALTLTNSVDGYGFFVVGDACDEWRVNVVLTNEVPDGFSAGAGDNIYLGPGVINLKNPQNVVIDSVAYGARTAGSHYIATQDTDSHSLSATTVGQPGYDGNTFEWSSSLDPSPGVANAGQLFQERPTSERGNPVAFHDPGRTIVPDMATEKPFGMIFSAPASDPPKPVTVNANVAFVLGYPAGYGEDVAGTLLYRHLGESTFRSLGADLLPNTQEGTNAFIAATFPAKTFTRLDTIEYYFVFNPDDEAYNDVYVAAPFDDGDEDHMAGRYYDDGTLASEHPFSFTFPFHDSLEFITLDTAKTALANRYPFADTVSFPAEPGTPSKLVIFLPKDYDDYPATSEIGLEATTNRTLAADSWEKIAIDSIEAIPLNTGSADFWGTYYAITFEPEAPMFIRAAPTRQLLPVPDANADPGDTP